MAGAAPVEVGSIEEVDRTAGPVALLVVCARLEAAKSWSPSRRAHLRRIDLPARRVEMALPEGLLDLNSTEKPVTVSIQAVGKTPNPAIIESSMRFDILTIFPGFFSGIFENGILRRAIAEGLVEIAMHDLRTFTHDRHRTVDDRPFGGGEGMVLKPEPIAEALASLGIEPKANRAAGESELGEEAGREFQTRRTTPSNGMRASAPADNATRVILLSRPGQSFHPGRRPRTRRPRPLVLICGRYEGVDERINQLYCDMELSIGDYVLSGGELAARCGYRRRHAPHSRRARQRSLGRIRELRRSRR